MPALIKGVYIGDSAKKQQPARSVGVVNFCDLNLLDQDQLLQVFKLLSQNKLMLLDFGQDEAIVFKEYVIKAQELKNQVAIKVLLDYQPQQKPIVVGFAVLELFDQSLGAVRFLAINLEYQRKGWGYSLLQACENWFKNLQVEAITFAIYSCNQSMMQLAAKLDYQCVNKTSKPAFSKQYSDGTCEYVYTHAYIKKLNCSWKTNLKLALTSLYLRYCA